MGTDAIEVAGLGTVEVERRTDAGGGEFPYDVRLDGVRGRVLIVERDGVPKRAPSGQGWRRTSEPRLTHEQLDAIATAIIQRDWGVAPAE